MVPMGRWAVAAAPTKIRTLLGSCAGVVLYDRAGRLGGVAHVVLPASNGLADEPGKYADTAIPAMIADLDRLRGRGNSSRLTAKVVGGASMFQAGPAMDIGKRNRDAVEQVLAGLGIPILARDVGGEAGRRMTFDTASGVVSIRVPGGEDYEI
jgi:chemotaxis protein CheD